MYIEIIVYFGYFSLKPIFNGGLIGIFMDTQAVIYKQNVSVCFVNKFIERLQNCYINMWIEVIQGEVIQGIQRKKCELYTENDN